MNCNLKLNFDETSNFHPITDGNGLAATATYDLDERLSSLRVLDGVALVQDRAFVYADGINLTGITDQVTALNSNTLSYSPAKRLAAASGVWGSNSFTYDGVGNRLTNVTSSKNRIATTSTTSNRLTGMTENGAALRSYTYDGAGNTLTDVRPGESFAYVYSKRNRLASVTRNTVAYGTYVYNALEQLASRTSTAAGAPIGAVHYIYDLDGHLIAEATGATGANLRDYIWLPANDNQNDTYTEDVLGDNDNSAVDMPLAVAEAATIYYIHTDHLGRPIRMTDAVKTTVWAATWKPWGEIQSISGTTTNNLRFPGQYFQIETGMHYNWHRNYDPVTGRYTQPDPLGFVDGPSIYAYAGNSPFMNVDREGLAKKFVKPPNPNQKKGAEDRQKSGERERNVGHEKGEEHSRRPKGGFKPKGMRGLGRGSSGLGWLELLPSKQKCILLPKYFECSPPPKQCFPDTNSNSSGW